MNDDSMAEAIISSSLRSHYKQISHPKDRDALKSVYLPLGLGRVLQFQCKHFRHERMKSVMLVFNAGLPDGLFSNQKCKFGNILEGLAMQDVGMFYGHLVHFTVCLLYFIDVRYSLW
jgi:hypothetical protein